MKKDRDYGELFMRLLLYAMVSLVFALAIKEQFFLLN